MKTLALAHPGKMSDKKDRRQIQSNVFAHVTFILLCITAECQMLT